MDLNQSEFVVDPGKISSQNSELGTNDLDKLEAKAQAENTKRATSWDVNKFEKWCEKRKLKVNLKSVSPAELNEVLRIFLKLNPSEKGQPLTPSALTGIQVVIHRQFLPANKMFEAESVSYES